MSLHFIRQFSFIGLICQIFTRATFCSVLKIYRPAYFSDSLQNIRHNITLLRINNNVTINSHVSPILLQVSQEIAEVGQNHTIKSGAVVRNFRVTTVLQKADFPRCQLRPMQQLVLSYFWSKFAPIMKKMELISAPVRHLWIHGGGNPVLQGIKLRERPHKPCNV